MKQQRGNGRGSKQKQPAKQVKPHFPLASEDDIRHHFTSVEQRLALQSIQIAFTQGAGSATLSDSGRISYTVDFSLPTTHTVRLIRAASAPASA